jgi:putative ABC transport system permease protein
MDQEMRFHLESYTEDLVRSGVPREEAERRARLEFGGVEVAQEQCREARGMHIFDQLRQDLSYAFRVLRKNPGYAAVVVTVLALGIGANTAIFSVVNAILLRPLPFERPDRLVMVWQTNPQHGSIQDQVSYLNLTDWREQQTVFEEIGAFNPRGMSLTGSGEPEHLPGCFVSANLFPLLGIKPMLGRYFLPEEDRAGGEFAVVISHSLWQRRFGSDPQILGRAITLNGASYTVVAVMPAGFQFPVQGQFPIPTSELWAPLAIDSAQTNRQAQYLFAVGRLKPGVMTGQAQAEMASIAERLAEQYPAANRGLGVNLVPLHEQITGNLRRALLVLLGAVGFVLLIACANVANLLLARSTGRQKEIAIRMALGAGRSRLLRQLLTESMLLALAGGAVGLLLAFWGVRSLVAFLPANMPRAAEIGVDRQVLGFASALALLTGIVFGLLPAWQASKPDLNEGLKEGGGKGVSGSGRLCARSLLVVTEVALAMVLLLGAGLLMKSFYRLLQVNLGFNPENAISVPFVLPQARYPDGNARAAFIKQVTERLKALPGVEAVGGVNTLPLSGDYSSGPFAIEGRPLAPGEVNIGNRRAATPDYFRTLSIPLLKGRIFTEQDDFNAPPVVIINETLARRYWPGEDPIGKRLIIPPGPNGTALSVIGVVGDVRNAGLEDEPKPEFYYAYFQNRMSYMVMVVRAGSDPASLISAARREIWAVDKDLPLANISTLEQLLAKTTAQRRFNLLLLGLFAALALALAAVGIYGVMAYTVMQRRHEIGIRMALGAEARDVRKLIVRQGMNLVFIGVGIGLGAAFALTRLMTSLLFEVSATDPLTFTSVAVLLTLVALLACFLPARRATKVDPVIALRYE